MPGDRDRRRPFTPGPGVPLLQPTEDSDKTPVNRIDLVDLRDDIRALTEAQTADRKQLNGRIGAIDAEVRTLSRDMGKNTTLTQVTATKVDSVSGKVDQLLARSNVEAEAKAQVQVAQTTASAQVQSAQLGLRGAKWSTVGKFAAAVVSAVLGLVVGHFLSGCM